MRWSGRRKIGRRRSSAMSQDVDLAGRRFGKLLVIRRLSPKTRSGRKRIFWRCRCDCGATKAIAHYALVGRGRRTTKSCGCLKIQDFTGKKFGLLTVLHFSGYKGQYATWWCQCDCGNRVRRRLGPSFRNTLSCGCHLRKLRSNDITGVRFGRLVVIEDLKKEKGNNFWTCKCKCDCGNETTKNHRLLIRGMTKSCGCLLSERGTIFGKEKFKDITGEKFHRLLALHRLPPKKGGKIYFRFQCDCGNVVDLDKGQVVGGGTKSCGCLRKSANCVYSREEKRWAKRFIKLVGRNSLGAFEINARVKITGVELKSLREGLSLTQVAAAASIDVCSHSWQRWETSEKWVPEPAARLFRIVHRLENT